MKTPLPFFVILFTSNFVIGATPVSLIIDTDLGFDVDDVGAIAVANHLQDLGVCRILGIVHNTGFYYGIGGVDTINHFYNRSATLGGYHGPWGSSQEAQKNQNRYTSTILKNYPQNVQNYDQVPTSVEAYEKILNKAEDHSVVIASIGELTNLRDILEANKTLFIQKVKEIYYMDGSYNFGCGDAHGSGTSPWLGPTQGCDGAAQKVIDNIPKTIKQVFTLNGANVCTGGRFNGASGCGQGPVKEAYQIWTNDGCRASWDPITVYLAVMGDTSLMSSLQAGTIAVDAAGNEKFNTEETGNNQYHVWIDNNHLGDITRILDNALCAAPCRANDISIGACAGYSLNSMKNCYSGHGGLDLETPKGSSAGLMTLHLCQQLCDKTPNCQGITVSNGENDGLVNCYRRGDLNLGSCAGAYNYDTWVKKQN